MSADAPFPPTPDAPLRTPSNLRLRILASIAMIAVASVALYAGEFLFWLLMIVGALLMMDEWGNLQKTPRPTKRLAQFALSVPLATMAPTWLVLKTLEFFTLGLIGAAAFFVVIVTRLPRLALGILYCALPVLALIFLRRQEHGLLFAFWAMSLVWACDIGAFFAGRAIGGPKLAPALSPNKTWAGLIGGVTLATIVALLLHRYEGLPWRMTLATPLLAVLAQGGDLYESWLKRQAGVKDSGSILPGHGGILDRVDGLVPVAPVAALVAIAPLFYR